MWVRLWAGWCKRTQTHSLFLSCIHPHKSPRTRTPILTHTHNMSLFHAFWFSFLPLSNFSTFFSIPGRFFSFFFSKETYWLKMEPISILDLLSKLLSRQIESNSGFQPFKKKKQWRLPLLQLHVQRLAAATVSWKGFLSLHCACYDPSSAARNDVSLTFTAFKTRQKVGSVQGCSFLKIAEKERKRKLVRSSDSLAGKLD